VGRRVVALVGLVVTLAFTGPATPSSPGESFFVGFSEDLPKELGSGAITPAAQLGGRAFRLTTLWSSGQTVLTAAEMTKLDRATAAAGGQRLVLTVFADSGAKAPQDTAARTTYCSFVRGVLTRYSSIRDVVIWNEPNKSLFWTPQLDAAGAPIAAARYTDLLARCYDVLHAAFPSVNVIGPALSSTGNDNAGSASPGAFIRSMGEAYRASGRQARLLDTIAHHPYGADATERPWRKHIGLKTIAQGDWNKLLYNLYLAFGGTSQPLLGQGSVRLWYSESGVQTAVDAAKAAVYTGTENVKTVPAYAGGEPESPAPAETTSAPDQWTQALDAIRLAACQPYVSAYFNFLLADEPRLAGWQSGPLWADMTEKPSALAFRQAIAEATGGTVGCDALKGGRPSPDFMPPGAPSGLSGAAPTDPLRVELSWSPAGDDTGVTSYRVFRNGAHVATTSTTSWTNVSVSPGATYTYAVRALDAAGNMGDASASVQVTVTTPDTVAPSAPGTPVAQALSGPPRIDLNWAAATDNVAVTAYEVSRDGVVIGAAAGTAYSDTTVGSGRTYAYTVVALDGAGNRGPASPPVTVTSLDSSAPTQPGSLRAVAANGPDRVELSWTASADDVGVVGYEIVRDGALLAKVTTTAYTDGTARAGTTFAYAVRALDAAGNRSAAATASAKVADVIAPSAPTGVSASAFTLPTRVSVAWSAASDNVAVAVYRVYRNGILVATTSSLSYVDSAVTRFTIYRYAVRAVDGAGNQGPMSATVTVMTR
jgi:fibronectin type 3 domain-containing protein